MRLKLTNSSIKKIKATGKEFSVGDTEIPGFHLRVNKDGTATFRFKYKNLQGKRRVPSIGVMGAISADMARQVAVDWYAKTRSGIDIVAVKEEAKAQAKKDEAATLGAFIEKHYKAWLDSQTKPNAQRGKKDTLRNLNVDFKYLHNTPMKDITHEVMQKYQDDMLARPLMPSTINRRITSLRGCLTRAVKMKLLDSNPLGGLEELPETRDTENQKPKFLTEAQEERLYAALEARQEEQRKRRIRTNKKRRKKERKPELNGRFTDYLLPMIKALQKTGMRRGEAFMLERRDIILFEKDGRLIGNIFLRAETTKSGKSRTISLGEDVSNVLKIWLSEQPVNKYDLVFPSTRTGSQLTCIYDHWKDVTADAGLLHVRIHDLRHDYGSKLAMAGNELFTIMKLMGHANPKQTIHYMQLSPDHLQAAALSLDSANAPMHGGNVVSITK